MFYMLMFVSVTAHKACLHDRSCLRSSRLKRFDVLFLISSGSVLKLLEVNLILGEVFQCTKTSLLFLGN